MTPSPGAVTLPPGVKIAPGRETTQAWTNGQLVQGYTFTLTLPSGAQPSVFIPYSVMSNKATVAQLIAERIAQVEGVVSLGG